MVPRFKKGRSIIFHKVNISGPRGLVVLVLVVVYCGSRVVLVLLVIVGVVVVAKVLVSRSSSSSICSSLKCSFYSAFTSTLNTFVFLRIRLSSFQQSLVFCLRADVHFTRHLQVLYILHFTRHLRVLWHLRVL